MLEFHCHLLNVINKCNKSIIYFLLCQKNIWLLKSCSIKIFSKFPTVNMSKHIYFLYIVICIAKNLIWTMLKQLLFSQYFDFFSLFLISLIFQ